MDRVPCAVLRGDEVSVGERFESRDRLTDPETVRRARMAFLVLCGITVILGGVHTAARGESLTYHDESQYLEVARNLASGLGYSLDGVTPTAFRPPGYSLLLVAPVKLGLGVPGCRALNYLLFLGCLGLSYALVRRHAGLLAGTLAPLACLAYPVLFYAAGTLYPQTLAALLLLLAAWLLLAGPRLSAGAAVLLGLDLAAMTLTVPTLGLLIPFVVLWQLAVGRSRSLGPLGIMLAATCLAILPWTLRNAAAFDSFIPLSTNGGYNLLLGNDPSTRPNAGVNVDLSAAWTEAAAMDEVGKDRYFRERALAWIAAHPADAARLYLLKFLNYFNYRNDIATTSEQSPGRDLLALVTYSALGLLVIVRLATARRRPLERLEWFILLFYLWYGLGLAVFFTRIRFRVPLDYLLACLAAISAAHLIQRRARRAEAAGSAHLGRASDACGDGIFPSERFIERHPSGSLHPLPDNR